MAVVTEVAPDTFRIPVYVPEINLQIIFWHGMNGRGCFIPVTSACFL